VEFHYDAAERVIRPAFGVKSVELSRYTEVVVPNELMIQVIAGIPRGEEDRASACFFSFICANYYAEADKLVESRLVLLPKLVGCAHCPSRDPTVQMVQGFKALLWSGLRLTVVSDYFVVKAFALAAAKSFLQANGVVVQMEPLSDTDSLVEKSETVDYGSVGYGSDGDNAEDAAGSGDFSSVGSEASDDDEVRVLHVNRNKSWSAVSIIKDYGLWGDARSGDEALDAAY
jgi:hypothetical protein